MSLVGLLPSLVGAELEPPSAALLGARKGFGAVDLCGAIGGTDAVLAGVVAACLGGAVGVLAVGGAGAVGGADAVLVGVVAGCLGGPAAVLPDVDAHCDCKR